jgi:hypothetical protein
LVELDMSAQGDWLRQSLIYAPSDFNAKIAKRSASTTTVSPVLVTSRLKKSARLFEAQYRPPARSEASLPGSRSAFVLCADPFGVLCALGDLGVKKRRRSMLRRR